MTNGSLMKVKSIVECWSILQYFWPALSDDWSWKPIFCVFESGRFTVADPFILFLYMAWPWNTNIYENIIPPLTFFIYRVA